jgi:uncharacterized protein (DUF885 family)
MEIIMRNLLIALTAVATLTACGKDEQVTETQVPASTETTRVAETAPEQSESERLNEWFELRFEEQLQFSPISLTFMGRKERYDEVDDMSEAAEDKQLVWQRGTVEEMEREFDYDKLTPEAKISYDIWKYQYENAAAGVEFRGSSYVYTQMQGAQSMVPTLMINFHSVDERSEMEAYIKRIGGMSRALNQLTDRAQSYAENGVRPPRFAYEGVLDQAQKVVTGAPFDDSEDSAIWADARRKVDALVEADKVSAEEAEALLEAASNALLSEFKPAYDRLISWVETEIPKSDEIATGVGNFPNGEAFYNYQLASSTTTDMSADEVHELGLFEVARIRGEMEQVMYSVGFEGDLQEFFIFVRDSDQFYFPDTDDGRQEYIDAAEDKLAFIDQRLPEYFGILPKAPLVVKRVEPYREQDGAAQHYFPGTPDGSRPGIYYMHLSDMTGMPKGQLEVIAYHEGSPGHHMQISIAQELQNTPTFRTQAGFGAYSEGWGLYSELLAKEMGAYNDPYSDFGRLSSEMWRALRLVVDTGLHSKGWTEQQAIVYMMANSPEPLESVTSEVQRYIVWPGQATSYKVGMLKILELRARAEAELGERFDISGFHDTILGGGAMPLAVLERRVDTWITTMKDS